MTEISDCKMSISGDKNGQLSLVKQPKGLPPGVNPQISAKDADEYFSTMQQGIVVWSKEGECEFFNQQMIALNELAKDQMYVGYKRISMLQKNLKRGTKDTISLDDLEQRFAANTPFIFDRETQSGRTIVAAVQPRTDGGHIVTFADVTDKRSYEVELAKAKKDAEIAQEHAQSALIHETKRKHQSKLLGELGEWLQSCKSLSELYKVIARFMETLFVGSGGELFVYSNSRDVLESACSWNQCTGHSHIHADDCWALRRGRIFKYGFGLVDFSCSHVDQDMEASHDKGPYVCLPIVAHGDTVGLLHIDFTGYKNPESKHKLQTKKQSALQSNVPNRLVWRLPMFVFEMSYAINRQKTLSRACITDAFSSKVAVMHLALLRRTTVLLA